MRCQVKSWRRLSPIEERCGKQIDTYGLSTLDSKAANGVMTVEDHIEIKNTKRRVHTFVLRASYDNTACQSCWCFVYNSTI